MTRRDPALAVGYGIEVHQHRFAAWAASRAASVMNCRFGVEQGRVILETSGFTASFCLPAQLPEPEPRAVDEAHRQWRADVMRAATSCEGPPSIEVKHSRLLLRVPPRTGEERRKALIEAWYREQLKEGVPPLLARWQRLLGVSVQRFFVQRMKTRWGSCNPATGTIRLNTDLAKKPRGCLEYLVVHEMIHLIEPTHNARFVALMDGAMPQWRIVREQLNRLPVRHDEWAY